MNACVRVLRALVPVVCVGFGFASVPVVAAASGTAPAISGEAFSNVGATGVTVSAQIEAGGEQTSYRVEYGTSKAYGSSTAEASLGNPSGPVGAQIHLTGLQAGASYHFRFVADNVLGVTQGNDVAFTTLSPTGPSVLSLPDNRAYELVSSFDSQEVAAPENVAIREEDPDTIYPLRAAASGDAVAYVAAPPVSGASGNGSVGGGEGNQWFAARGQEGWSTSDITPTGSNVNTHFEGFSSDLSIGILHGFNRERLAPNGPACRQSLYLRAADGSLHSLFASPSVVEEKCGEPLYAGTSPDGSHVLFQDEAVLTAEAEPTEEEEGSDNLYEAVGGQLRSVNVLGGKADPNATFGGPSSNVPNPQPDFSNVISDDGSRVFWTDLNTGEIYVREDGTRTVPVSLGAAQYWTATPDGRYVLYTEDENLWRFDVQNETREELVGDGSVKGTVAASEDGSYVYFVAGGVLAGNENGNKQRATVQTCTEPSFGSKEEDEEDLGDLKDKGCNLYLLHIGESPRFIATLAPKDNNLPGIKAGTNRFGDWQPDMAYRVAEATPNGSSLVFESRQNLTGYDNHSSSGGQGAVEVFVYDSGLDRISCTSCSPNGALPIKTDDEQPSWLQFSDSDTFMLRLIAGNGNAVFFDTEQSLVSQDTNGVVDVYEWEPDGVGSCSAASASVVNAGCVFLLSGGSSSNDSFFVDASADGGNVFFTSRAQLVAQDEDERMDLYDARVDGGFPRLSLACTGTGCQGVPPAPPVFATPSSATFAGVGNFESPASPSAVKPKAKPKRCAHGFVREHGRCVKRHAKTKARAGGRSKRGRK